VQEYNKMIRHTKCATSKLLISVLFYGV